VQNLNLRHIYLIGFLIFGAVFVRLASKFEKSTNMIFKRKKFSQKNAEFYADFKSVEKVIKNAPKKVISKTN
jgi:hypothetical protein